MGVKVTNNFASATDPIELIPRVFIEELTFRNHASYTFFSSITIGSFEFGPVELIESDEFFFEKVSAALHPIYDQGRPASV